MGESMLDRLAALAPVMKTISLPRGRHRLHTMPTSTGYEVRSHASYAWDGMKRGRTPFTVLQHTISGIGNLRFERRNFKVTPGETMLVLAPHNHRYWVEAGNRWEFFWISMNGQEALRIHRAIQAVTGPVLRLRPDTIEHLADCAYRLIDGRGESPGAASAIAYEAAAALYDDVFGSHGISLADDGVVRKVVEFILANLEKPLAVADLAEVSGFSRAHFSRIFAASEGMPPAEFVLQERMRRSARLLAGEAAMSIKEVAAHTGFPDPNYFAKVFRRHFGTSPTEFRTTGMYASR